MNHQDPVTRRTNYLRGISASAPLREINHITARTKILDAVFSEIADPLHWKNPINVVMDFHEEGSIGIGIYLDAIEYFTSTKAELFFVKNTLDSRGKQINTYRIVSEGYDLSSAGG